MGKKTKELPRIMSLGTRAPVVKADEIPHWRVWRWSQRHPGQAWSK